MQQSPSRQRFRRWTIAGSHVNMPSWDDKTYEFAYHAALTAIVPQISPKCYEKRPGRDPSIH